MANDGRIIIGAGGTPGYVGDDMNNKGFFATDTALDTAYPVGVDGWYAVVGATDTIWIWDEDTEAWIDSGSGFTAGGMLQATYDPNSVEGDVFDMDNMVEGATNKILVQAERDKLDGIEENAQVNVKPDWNAAPGNEAEILNKPTIPTNTANLPDSLNKRYVTDAQKTVISNTSGVNTGDETAAGIKTKLETLTDDDRLDASAIKNITSGSAVDSDQNIIANQIFS